MPQNHFRIRILLTIMTFAIVLSTTSLSALAMSVSNCSTTNPVYGLVSSNATPYLTIRSSANINSSSLGQVYPGNYVMIVGQSGDFYRIQYTTQGQAYGYVHKDYVTDMSSSCPGKVKAVTSGPSINVRDIANINGSSIGYMPNNSYAPALSSQTYGGGWYHVVWGIVQGYVYGSNTEYTSY